MRKALSIILVVIALLTFGKEYFYYLKGFNLQNLSTELAYASPVVLSFSKTDNVYKSLLEVQNEGYYFIQVVYKSVGDSIREPEVSVKINGSYPFDEAQSLVLSKLWKDISQSYSVDRLGNELFPEQEIYKGKNVFLLRHPSNVYNLPLIFKLKEGKNLIELEVMSGEVNVESISLIPVTRSQNFNNTFSSKELEVLITLEAEKYSYKNDTRINPQQSRDIEVVPYDTYRLKMNTLGGESWKYPGQTVYYKFSVPQDGYYKLAFKYKQDYNVGMNSYRRLYIDNKVPYEELMNYPFKYTAIWQIETLNVDGKEIVFFLEKGNHSLAIETVCGLYENVIVDMNRIKDEINDLVLQIRKIAGFSPNRYIEWEIRDYFPNIDKILERYSKNLRKYKEYIQSLNDRNFELRANFDYVIMLIDELRRDPNRIPQKLEQLNGSTASINSELTIIIDKLASQPLLLDQIYVYSGTKPSIKKASTFTRFSEWFKRFVYSFKITRPLKSEKKITVWVNRPKTYVDILQRLVDEDFTKKTGITVELALINNEQKLILSYIANKAPDIAIGISNWLPFDMGIRGALQNLRYFKDFSEVSKRFSPGAFIPYIYEDNCFALPETQDFYALFYRKDIVEKLRIQIPQTWDEVMLLMPELQRYGLNFYIPLAGSSGFKPWQATAPFIFQTGGKLFTEDGIRTAIDDENTIRALRIMTDLFRIYGLALQVPNFFEHFRTGTIPFGVSNLGTYIQLTVAAPELRNRWTIAPMPGIRNSNGEIVRWAPGSAQSSVIFNSSKNKEYSWEFLKWWTSETTQRRFGRLLELTYGKEYLWNSSNLNAFKYVSIPEEHKEVILEQWKWLKEVPKTPASYMLEREISNIWNKVVFNNVNLRIAVEDSVKIVNKEIERKLTEFSYIENGKVIKLYRIPDLEDVYRWWKE